METNIEQIGRGAPLEWDSKRRDLAKEVWPGCHQRRAKQVNTGENLRVPGSILTHTHIKIILLQGDVWPHQEMSSFKVAGQTQMTLQKLGRGFRVGQNVATGFKWGAKRVPSLVREAQL